MFSWLKRIQIGGRKPVCISFPSLNFQQQTVILNRLDDAPEAAEDFLAFIVDMSKADDNAFTNVRRCDFD